MLELTSFQVASASAALAALAGDSLAAADPLPSQLAADASAAFFIFFAGGTADLAVGTFV